MPSLRNRNDKIKPNTSKASTSKLALGVHFMPKTSEKSFKIWFILGILIFLLIIILLLILI